MILPLLPLQGTVVFPGSTVPLAIGNPRSITLVEAAVAGDRECVLAALRSGRDDVYEIGTLARIRKLLRVPDGTLRILVEGIARVRLERTLKSAPYLIGEFAALPNTGAAELERLAGLRLLNVTECQRVLEETSPELVAAIVRRELECERLLQPIAHDATYAVSGLPLTAPV